MTALSPRSVMIESHDLPVRSPLPVHSGKVRSLYRLSAADSARLVEARGYPVPRDSALALMVISDRLSAFDCLWQSETLAGVPGKGAALNAISAHWFAEFERSGLPPHHLLEMPHPMLWVVRQARPIRIEAIARRYLAGSLWRAYRGGAREAGGTALPEGLTRFAQLPRLVLTPSTKGVLRGLEGVPEYDDAPVEPALLTRHFAAFGFASSSDVQRCSEALARGFECISTGYAALGELLVDSKFEFGYAPDGRGGEQIIYMDEAGTPDSSRIWRREDWERGAPREHSKEQFREALLGWVGDPDLLLDSSRFAERQSVAASRRVPDAFFEALSVTYLEEAGRVLGRPLEVPDSPREALLDLLAERFDLLR